MRKQQSVNTPPLRDPAGNTLTRRSNFSCTHVQLEDLEDLETPHFPETVDTWSPLTTEEVRKAINKAGDTTPGPDAVPNAALKLAWPHLGDAITAMYNLSLEWSRIYSLAPLREQLYALSSNLERDPNGIRDLTA
jgi:hypothetical protein